MVAPFDLLTEPWLPVRQGDRLIEVSLQDALLHADEYQGLEDQSPLVVNALHRFLLAVLHRALVGPRDVGQAAAWFQEGFPVDPLRAYFAEHRNRFDLFSPTAPFYQVPGFGLDLSKRSWTTLTPELNSDNNKVLFDHTITTHPDPLPPARAARLLIANQATALSAGKSVFRHTAYAPISTAVTLLVQGTTLRETLCLNLAHYTAAAHRRDRAAWEEDSPTVATLRDAELAHRPPVGIVDRYTWQSRAIRLHPEDRGGEATVTWISYASGMRCDDDAAIPDPLVAYRRDPQDALRRYPLGFREGRALWRDFAALLRTRDRFEGVAILEFAGSLYERVALLTGAEEGSAQVLVLGQANDQAKVEFWRAERYTLPAALLADPDLRTLVHDCLEQSDEVGRRLNGAARALAAKLLTGGDRQPHKDDVTRLVNSFPHGTAYWATLEGAFGLWLARLDRDAAEHPAPHKRAWHDEVDAAARRAWALTARTAGDEARALRAVFGSEGLLFAYLAQQRKERVVA